MKIKSSDNLSVVPSVADAGRVVLDGEVAIGEVGVVETLRVRRVGEEIHGVGWNSKGETIVRAFVANFGCEMLVLVIYFIHRCLDAKAKS